MEHLGMFNILMIKDHRNMYRILFVWDLSTVVISLSSAQEGCQRLRDRDVWADFGLPQGEKIGSWLMIYDDLG